MTQPFLYMRTNSTTHSQCAVFKEINMQLVQVGSDFGTDEDTTNVCKNYNRVIHWENDLYALNGDNIWKYDVANSGDWGLFHAFATPQAHIVSKAKKIGFTACSIDGSGVLVCGYPSVSNLNVLKIVTIDKAGNVSEGPEFTVTEFNSQATDAALGMSAVSWRNSIVFKTSVGSSSAYFKMYDLKTNTLTNILTPSTQYMHFHNDQTCVAKDKVYTCGYQQFNVPGALLQRIDGNVSVAIATIGGEQHPNTAFAYSYGSALCNIGDKLFCFIPVQTNAGTPGVAGWDCFEITLDDNGNYISHANVTSIVIPSPMNIQNTTSSCATVRIDTVSNGPGNPIYELLVANTNAEGGSLDLYRWNNAPSGQLSLVDAGGDAKRFSLVATADGTGGGRIWSGSGTLNASQPNLSLDGGVINAEFTVYGDNQPGVSLELLYSKYGGVCDSSGTIVSTTLGTIVGNKVTGLTADNTTSFVVGWSAAVDGIVPGDNPKVAARVSIP